MRYDVFNKLNELMSLTKTEKGYSKFVQTGLSQIPDYGKGFLEISLELIELNNEYFIRLIIGTIDDNNYGAFTKVNSLDKGNLVIETVANTIFKDMIQLPPLNDLNILLRNFGIYVHYE